IAGLRGRVVLVDFWTYSCINCQRSLPHVEAWNRAYAADGLTVIGVHTPEFAFEHVVSKVAAAARQLGVLYPVAIDNQYATWTAYENSYWPAEYLIDASGRVRHVDFGEGQYQQTESFIRQLLVAADPKVVLPRATDVADTMPTEQTTPESYLGYQHPQNLAGQTMQEDRMSTYQAPASIPQDEYAYNGEWSIGSESATAGQGAMLSLHYQARDVYLVLGGSGTIKVSVDGVQTRAIVVGGGPRLYQLVGSDSYQQRLLSLAVSPGVQAYDFTFGQAAREEADALDRGRRVRRSSGPLTGLPFRRTTGQKGGTRSTHERVHRSIAGSDANPDDQTFPRTGLRCAGPGPGVHGSLQLEWRIVVPHLHCDGLGDHCWRGSCVGRRTGLPGGDPGRSVGA